MSNKKPQYASRLLLVLLFFTATSALAATQQRYTVNRPVSAVLPAPALIKEEQILAELAEFVPQNIPIYWETDYEYARETARQSMRCLLIYFYVDCEQKIPESLADVPVMSACRKFGTVILDDVFVRARLDWYVLLKLPIDFKVTAEDGTEQPIYSLPGFEHMLGHPGLVVIDYARRDMPYYGEVVGILPFLWGESPTTRQTITFLDLPPGTLSQRTLTYAVRIHPDRPESANGEPAPIVVQMATEHAEFQAERGVIGHHNYSARVYQAKEVLGGGTPAEICAQTRPGLGLFEGSLASMRLWRNSPAHWSIARRSHTYYGFDMVQGKNGAWFAVGFFIN